MMLISAFARRAGLTTDTVRYYVRIGLLRPEASAKGGEHPYLEFSVDDLLAVRIVRTAQSLGLSLKEIAAISQARRAGNMTKDRSIAVLSGQLDRLEAKAVELNALKRYFKAKLAWLKADERGPPPELDTLNT
jgi:MerR family transcriptional regulator, copper efflux regulator